jgi:hypothetical protein
VAATVVVEDTDEPSLPYSIYLCTTSWEEGRTRFEPFRDPSHEYCPRVLLNLPVHKDRNNWYHNRYLIILKWMPNFPAAPKGLLMHGKLRRRSDPQACSDDPTLLARNSLNDAEIPAEQVRLAPRIADTNVVQPRRRKPQWNHPASLRGY